MTWEQIQKLFKIEIEQSLIPNQKLEVRVKIESMNKKGHYMFSYDIIDYNNSYGVDTDDLIKKKIIQDFELEKWVGEKIK